MHTRVSIHVRMCENLGIQANLSQARNRMNMIYGCHYQASTQLRYQRFANCLEVEPRVRTPIGKSLLVTHNGTVSEK